MNDDEAANYDEFGMLKQYADHEGIVWRGRPQVERRTVAVGAGQGISGIVWGGGEPELVFLHGGGQNAHTWDSVAMALDRPLVAFDLPGHGHSDWREDKAYWPVSNAEAMAEAIEQVAPSPQLVVGMSLGGLTTIRLASVRPDLVPRAVVVDVTPGVGPRTKTMTQEQRGATSLIAGPPVFDSFDEMLQATAAAVPGRPIESLRPGVLHNARRLPDGRWAWRYDRLSREGDDPIDFASLWEDLSAVKAPIMLVRGGKSAHVHDDDQEEFLRRQPGTRVEVVEGAGHSVQSDRATRLAELISDFVATT
jgi:pimeloyl-ACP methyl ester carboxylesterase